MSTSAFSCSSVFFLKSENWGALELESVYLRCIFQPCAALRDDLTDTRTCMDSIVHRSIRSTIGDRREQLKFEREYMWDPISITHESEYSVPSC